MAEIHLSTAPESVLHRRHVVPRSHVFVATQSRTTRSTPSSSFNPTLDYLRSMARNTALVASCYLSLNLSSSNEPHVLLAKTAADFGIIWIGTHFPFEGKKIWGAVEPYIVSVFAIANAGSFVAGFLNRSVTHTLNPF